MPSCCCRHGDCLHLVRSGLASGLSHPRSRRCGASNPNGHRASLASKGPCVPSSLSSRGGPDLHRVTLQLGSVRRVHPVRASLLGCWLLRLRCLVGPRRGGGPLVDGSANFKALIRRGVRCTARSVSRLRVPDAPLGFRMVPRPSCAHRGESGVSAASTSKSDPRSNLSVDSGLPESGVTFAGAVPTFGSRDFRHLSTHV